MLKHVRNARKQLTVFIMLMLVLLPKVTAQSVTPSQKEKNDSENDARNGLTTRTYDDKDIERIMEIAEEEIERTSQEAVKAALEQGKNVETRRGKLYDEVNQLQESLGQYEAAGRLLDSERFRTGKFQDILDEGGKILHAFGFDDQTLANLRMNRPQDAEAFQNLVMRNVFNELALQKGVQTEGDAQRAERLWASIRNTKEGNKWINDFARDVIQNKINLKREEMRLLRLHNGDLDKVMDGLLEYKNNQKSMFDKGGKYADLYDKNVGSAEAQAKNTMQQATSGNPVAEAGKKKSAVDYSKFER